MRADAAIGLLSAALLCGSAAAAQDWRLEHSDADTGIRIYLRTTPDGYREFRGVMRVKSRLSASRLGSSPSSAWRNASALAGGSGSSRSCV